MNYKETVQEKSFYKYILIFFIFALYLFLQNQYNAIRPDMFRNILTSFGVFSPVLFLLFSFIRPFAFFPITIFYLASGLAFGPFWGGILATLGAISGALTAHMIAQKTGIEFLPSALQEKILNAKNMINQNGFHSILMIRFIPLLSFDLISFASGLAKIQRKPYILGTLLGTTPRIFAYTFLGSSIVNISDANLWTILFLFMIIFILPLGVYKKIHGYKFNH
ncbi:Uncharacterized membrane protein YdjX, TVP38/TMEM64 family, SNARE-associated domain [Tindallia magadiensis]|uniref:TVP38/TMEM64 family membrane protein n=1 Tax=Tindallia magadiensis TaxID=69895 RepID=A0A1I3B1S6_9FIRM|nr:TVP38/TMEM64 family protein [Tindallia magadiensis]SFH56275.1 Uncharacterized membrane protein YdjX, TVP38/TMEM64 family, SNARE-associated domain [Tindallia magadiensis]